MIPAQCRAARDLLTWTQEDLARAAGVSVITVRKFESEEPAAARSAVVLMQRAFEGAGVEFRDPAVCRKGVRLKPRPR